MSQTEPPTARTTDATTTVSRNRRCTGSRSGAEEAVTKVRGQVEVGRDKLRGAHPAKALQPQDEEVDPQ